MILGVVLLPVILCVSLAASEPHFINEWAAHIEGGYNHAKRVAEEHGYQITNQLQGFDDHYMLQHSDVPHRSKRSADHHTRRLTSDTRVKWAEQQEVKSRSKRDYLEERSSEDRIYRQIEDVLDDPQFSDQWYLLDTRTDLSTPKKDLHVLPAWNKNITGRGVVVTILDDGIEWTHTDLKDNFDPEASYDYNDNDKDPMPRYEETNENKHGTRCAGEVAMSANNKKCGVGVAFNAKIGGVRMLDGKVTDMLEGQSIMHNHKYVDIYSASWGPNDDGHTVEGPGKLAKQAFEKGVTEGRGGKGVIYVWASGNGGRLLDNCDCDGYTGSIYTISISSASQAYRKPWYGERCASTMATTYSSGAAGDKKVVSTDLHDKCTDKHTGTSAAAPLAAGIFALLLEANPAVTWRDVQHLVTWTSQVAPLTHNEGWNKNAAGFWVNTAFGFGLLDATGLVEAADPKTWKSVPESFECQVNADNSAGLPVSLNSLGTNNVTFDIQTSGCEGQSNEINYLEHIILNITVDYSKRGDLGAYIISPSGTSTMLLANRDFDKSTAGYTNWGLTSVHTWGESPKGKWKVVFSDKSGNNNHGAVRDIKLTMFGTKDKPHHLLNGARKYNVDYNMVQNEKQDDVGKDHSGSKYADYLRQQLRLQLLKNLL